MVTVSLKRVGLIGATILISHPSPAMNDKSQLRVNSICVLTISSRGTWVRLTPESPSAFKPKSPGRAQSLCKVHSPCASHYRRNGNFSCCSRAQGLASTYDQGPNGIGHLVEMTDGASTTQCTYDVQGRVIRSRPVDYCTGSE